MNSLIIGFKTNKNFAFFSILALLLLAAAVFAPLLTSYQPTEADMKNAFLAPSAEHLFGTDKLGRDCFSRVLYGARNSLASALLLVVLVFSVGTALGVISGYIGGKTDAVIMRCADIFISFPGVLLAIAIAGIIGGSMLNAIISSMAARRSTSSRGTSFRISSRSSSSRRPPTSARSCWSWRGSPSWASARSLRLRNGAP